MIALREIAEKYDKKLYIQEKKFNKRYSVLVL